MLSSPYASLRMYTCWE